MTLWPIAEKTLPITWFVAVMMNLVEYGNVTVSNACPVSPTSGENASSAAQKEAQ